MNIFRNLHPYNPTKEIALTIGMFDGVHQGHQEIIKKLHDISKRKNLEPSVLSFWPHPRNIFNPSTNLKLLNTLDEKEKLLEKLNVENFFIQDFNDKFRNIEAKDFVENYLVKKLNTKHLIIGHDHRFGKNAKGNFSLLKEMGAVLDFEVEQLDAISLENQNISSTQIRNTLLDGKIKKANEMLSYFYPITGKVIHGKKIGRTIGYPTANIEIDENKILPKNGAYIVEVYLDNQFYKGMLSVGTNPTVNGEKITTEVYILDFDKNIYGKTITIKFRDFLHEEIKFESLEKLIERLDEDKQIIKSFIF